MDDHDRKLRRFTRLIGLQGLPEHVRRSIALAWCFGMGRDHAAAAEHLMRALEALLEGWDEGTDEAAGSTAEGNDHDEARDGRAADGSGDAPARPSGEVAGADQGRAGASLDAGGAL